MTSSEDKVKQQWNGDLNALGHGIEALAAGIDKVGKPLFLVDNNGQTSVAHEGNLRWCDDPNPKDESLPLLGFVPPLSPTRLGEASFKEDLGLKYAYIVGAMANGITSVEMVLAAGQAGMVGFFGAGGLSLEQIKTAIDHLKPHQDKIPVGFNLIHSPSDMVLEMKTVELYLQHGIHLVSASAYLGLTLPLVLYRVKGIHRRGDGTVVCPNHVVAKVSREEVAAKFFAPPPNKLLTQLVNDRLITPEEAELAQEIPMAQDITAEADSGGHTDNRPALSLLPTFLTLKESAMAQYRFAAPLRVGLGGGIATPDAAAAGFAMGAAYVLTGSINQAAVEADTSERVRGMLVEARQADVTMAPSADMFELGAKVQVLKRGTMFAMRAAKLYDLYRAYSRFEEIPENMRAMIERDMLRTNYEDAWEQTRLYFLTRDPSQIERAAADPKHQMALVFRSYLGQASLWAKTGVADRKIDYQIWCGPSMGAFNAWVKGSFLEDVQNRRTDVMGMNLMYGASRLMRCQWLRSQFVTLPAAVAVCRPLRLEEIDKRIHD